MQRSPLSASSASSAPSFPAPGFASAFMSSSRPTTRDGPTSSQANNSSQLQQQQEPPASKDRKPSFGRRASFSAPRRRGSSAASANSNSVVTDATAPPALPDYALAAAAKVVSRDRDRDVDPLRSPTSPEGFARAPSRTATMPTNPGSMMLPPTPVGNGPPGSSGSMYQQSEASMIHHQISELAGKRISTLDYLRKAHEGRVYWFNTYLFDKPDLGRMPYFDPRRLARKATNYLLLGLSLPTIADLYSSTPAEFLRSLNHLLSEFESFQQNHGDSSTSLSRARLPNMFRRQGGKSRRSGSAADMPPTVDENQPVPPIPGSAQSSSHSVMNFAASELELHPGEEYTYLLTPSLPFDPDFFETFATLCDVLIDCYTRFLALVPTPRECSPSIIELFTKADSRMRKIIVQGVVKDFEDHSRAHIKSEVASVGKVVLGGLM